VRISIFKISAVGTSKPLYIILVERENIPDEDLI
jgi:hypothetical protein